MFKRFIILITRQTDGNFNGHVFDTVEDPSSGDIWAPIETSPNFAELTFDNYRNPNVRFMWKSVDYIDASHIDPNVNTLLHYVGFRHCDVCGALVKPQDCRSGLSVFHRGKRYCAKCNNQRLADQNVAPTTVVRVHGYHCSGNPVVLNYGSENYDLNNVKGIGIEMEVNGSDVDDHVGDGEMEVLSEYARTCEGSHPAFRHEEDCTVAVELISNVMTLEYFRHYDWELFTRNLKFLGNDEGYKVVGHHVHLSKLWFGDTPKKQALNWLKFVMFMTKYKQDFANISGRDANLDSRDWDYCSFASDSQIKGWYDRVVALPDDATEYECSWFMEVGHGSEGCAAIASKHTYEIRIGHSTNDPEKIRHWVELLVGIAVATNTVPYGKIYCLGKMLKAVPTETRKYWNSKGAFLRTSAEEVRGITTR